MSPFAMCFFISGIICFLEIYYWMEINKDEDLNGMREQLKELKTVVYFVGLLLGWLLLPFEIVLLIYKNITGKSLF